MKALRVIATVLSGPLLLIGIVWVLQGVNILPGSFMTGHIIWAIYGAPMAVVGGGLVWWVNKDAPKTVLAVLAGTVIVLLGLAMLTTVLANGGYDYKVS